MKTYKIPAVKAASLRKQLLWTQIATFLSIFAAFIFIAANNPFMVGVNIIFGTVAVIWGTVAYWRALWNLWEWPGIALGVGAMVGVAILNTLLPFIGAVASFAFFVYVYMQLGKQTGEPQKVSSREVFSE